MVAASPASRDPRNSSFVIALLPSLIKVREIDRDAFRRTSQCSEVLRATTFHDVRPAEFPLLPTPCGNNSQASEKLCGWRGEILVSPGQTNLVLLSVVAK